jgi:hypothetical protein
MKRISRAIGKRLAQQQQEEKPYVVIMSHINDKEGDERDYRHGVDTEQEGIEEGDNLWEGVISKNGQENTYIELWKTGVSSYDGYTGKCIKTWPAEGKSDIIHNM